MIKTIVSALRRWLINREIGAERRRQDRRWGEQNHISVIRQVTPEIQCRVHSLPTETQARNQVELCAGTGTLAWADIAVEELAEVVAAPDDIERRMELVQLGAVIVAWIECIDRRGDRR